VERSFRVCQHLFISGALIGGFLLKLLVMGQLDWLLELSGACLCLCFPLLNFSSCSVDAFPIICASGHVHFLNVIVH